MPQRMMNVEFQHQGRGYVASRLEYRGHRDCARLRESAYSDGHRHPIVIDSVLHNHQIMSLACLMQFHVDQRCNEN